MTQPTDRLLSQLNQSQLQQKDNPLYQVIKQLIQRIKELESLTGVTSTTINETTFIQQIVMEDGGGEGGEMGAPGAVGPIGATGATGAEGPPFPAFYTLDGTDGEDGIGIPGPVGPTGNTGNTGADGQPFPSFIPYDGNDGEDALVIPGKDGASGTALQDWEGKVVACMADGNPNTALTIMLNTGWVGPTPTNITVNQGRVSYFKLKTTITVANIRWFGIGAVTTIYHIAIYRASDDVRMSADNEITTVQSTWGAVADSFTLAANTLYYCVVSADTTGSVAGLAAFGTTVQLTTGQIRILPSGWPGNLDFDSNIINSAAFAVVTVTTGVLPNPGNTPVAISANLTGGMPAIFLDAA